MLRPEVELSPTTDEPELPEQQDRPDTPPERLRKGRTLAERRQERRDALLDAGLELFGTKGFASTSVEEICRTAFVSTRNFYEEFENRDAVLHALGEMLIADAYRAMASVEVQTGPDRIRDEAMARVSGLVHALLDDPRKARIAFIESLGVSPSQEARRRQAHQLFAHYLAELVGTRLGGADFGTVSSELFSLALVGAVNEVLSDWVLREDKAPLDELTASVVDIIVLMSDALRG